jgi:hypothetical protein
MSDRHHFKGHPWLWVTSWRQLMCSGARDQLLVRNHVAEFGRSVSRVAASDRQRARVGRDQGGSQLRPTLPRRHQRRRKRPSPGR